MKILSLKPPSLKRGITAKLFWITTGLLIITTLIIYSATYFLLPRYYYVYKQRHLQSEVNDLMSQVNGLDTAKAGDILDQFALQNNLKLIVSNDQGVIVYPGLLSNAIWVHTQTGGVILQKPYTGNVQIPGLKSGPVVSVNASGTTRALSMTRDLKLRGMPALRLTVVAPLQPISEASHVLLLFLPYMFLIALVISVTGSIIYSMVVTRPLLNLNRIAKRMAKLDFAIGPKLSRNDEIGELSESLNGLAVNLQQTLQKLKNDIEREREEEVKRREFVAIISHELKSPLTAVLGQLEGMIGRIGVFKDRDKYLRQSYALMKTMEKLVYEILDISRMDRASFTPNIEQIDIQDLVLHVLDDNAYFADEKEIQVETKLLDAPKVKGDRKLLKQAVHNIVLNAIQYSPVKAKIHVQFISDEDGVVLEIENTGIHIDERLLDKVFDPFFRVEQSRSRQTGGSGLGLYIVKRNLEVQDIPYQFQNTDAGVSFTLNLRRA